jgi:hypothetical protein
MTAWHGLVGVGVVLGTAAALYGRHRLALWLEDHGRPYYRNKKPDSSPAGLWVGS